MKSRILVWDLPVRLFHLLLAIGFGGSYAIAKFLGEDSGLFPYHAMIGMTLALLVLLRIVWGIFGTRWARFRNLTLHPRSSLDYLAGVVTGKGRSYTGHNPATSVAMLLMFAAILGLAWTGYRQATGNESVESLHELLAWAMLALVGAHIAGVIIHSLRHRGGIVASMIHGQKQGSESDGIQGSAVLGGLILLAMSGFFLGSLISSFDPRTQTAKWPLSHSTLPLGEFEGDAKNQAISEDDD